MVLASLLGDIAARAESPSSVRPVFDVRPRPAHFPARAKAVIQLFMHGGPSHVDLLDPKPMLENTTASRRPKKSPMTKSSPATCSRALTSSPGTAARASSFPRPCRTSPVTPTESRSSARCSPASQPRTGDLGDAHRLDDRRPAELAAGSPTVSAPRIRTCLPMSFCPTRRACRSTASATGRAVGCRHCIRARPFRSARDAGVEPQAAHAAAGRRRARPARAALAAQHRAPVTPPRRAGARRSDRQLRAGGPDAAFGHRRARPVAGNAAGRRRSTASTTRSRGPTARAA